MKMSEYEGASRDVAAVFVNGFYSQLSQLHKDQGKLADAFDGAFALERTYIALMDGRPVGMVGLGDCTTRSTTVNKGRFRVALGFFRGSIGYAVMKRELMSRVEFPQTTGYIENVATLGDYRGKGVATAILSHIFQNSSYSDYVLDVIDTNVNAIRLYGKIGFEEFRRVKNKRAKIEGYNEKIYMRYANDEALSKS